MIKMKKSGYSDRMEMVTEKRMPWWSDVAKHPDSTLLPFYTSGRCQNPTDVICPHCGSPQEPSHDIGMEEEVITECSHCEKGFRVESSFGYGYSTYAMTCRPGDHRFVFCAQYAYEGKAVRVFHCIHCEKIKMNKSDITLMPWLDEYDDPNYFDPEGKLLSRLEGEPKPTPVLDALEKIASPWCHIDERQLLKLAVEKHEKEWT